MRQVAVMRAVLCALVLCASAVRAAVIIEIVPAFQVISDSPAQIALRVSGLPGGMAPSIGGFDLTLEYDPAILSYLGTVFGSALGNPATEAIAFDDVPGVGLVRLFEVSLLDPDVLDADQPGTFTLATVAFGGRQPGISLVNFLSVELSDSMANPLTANTLNGAIQVVSEPDFIAIFAVAALAGWLARRRVVGANRCGLRGPRDV